jgi:hypothetical protein
MGVGPAEDSHFGIAEVAACIWALLSVVCIKIFVARSAGLGGWIIAIPLSHPNSDKIRGFCSQRFVVAAEARAGMFLNWPWLDGAHGALNDCSPGP